MLMGVEPAEVTDVDIDRWLDAIDRDELHIDIPALSYHEPSGWEKVGEPVTVATSVYDPGDEDVLNVSDFIANLEPGFYAVAEFRPEDLDVQRWRPVYDDSDEEEEISENDLSVVGRLLAEALGIDGSVDPCEDCAAADECSEEQKAEMREKVGYTG
jgi:hypothetical protein